MSGENEGGGVISEGSFWRAAEMKMKTSISAKAISMAEIAMAYRRQQWQLMASAAWQRHIVMA
jgi:hypothetical protein